MQRDSRNDHTGIESNFFSTLLAPLRPLRSVLDDPAYGLIAVSMLLFASSYLFDALLERTEPSTSVLVFLLTYAFALIALWIWFFYRALRRYFL